VNPRRYAGRLTYDDGQNHIDVDALIVRENEIAYNLASVSKRHGRWIAASNRPAHLQPSGSYLATCVPASKMGVNANPPWTISFTIEEELLGSSIELSGYIAEGSEQSSFYGVLEAK
jgi:hypothetical protein